MPSLGNFNANQVEPSGGDFEPLPAGKYEAMIIDSEEVENKNGSGKHLKLSLVVTRGECEGRTLWHRLNLWHENGGKVIEIARGQLSAICRAVGKLTPKDSVDLHGIPLMVTVKLDEYGEGKVSNKITSFSAREGVQPGNAPSAPPPPSSAPWKK